MSLNPASSIEDEGVPHSITWLRCQGWIDSLVEEAMEGSMFKYRVLLVDTSKSYQRPVQAHFQSLVQANDWAVTVLKTAGEGAYVQFYQVREVELGTISKEELNDSGPAPRIQSVED